MNRKTITLIVAAPLAAAVSGTLFWRWVSNRQERPCPPWLTILLENPYMRAVASAESILARLDLGPGMRILDAGCGPGRLTIPAAQSLGAAGHVTALDIQPEMLRRVQERAAESRCHNITYLQQGLGAGALPANSFDRALLVTVLGEVPQKEAALAEIYTALKPGGILSITEVLPDPHYQIYSTVRRLAVQAGFEPGKKWRNGLAYTAHFLKPDQGKLSVAQLGAIAETLVLPLYYRARESERPDALIRDNAAASAVQRLAYDFSPLANQTEQRVSTMLRARQCDQIVSRFLAEHPDGVVVELGCGLDTRFMRVDNGQATWFDLDLPEVMVLRQQVFGEEVSARHHLIGQSMLDCDWLDRVQAEGKRPCLFIAEGVFPYFDQTVIRELVLTIQTRFPNAELVFDSTPPVMEWASSLHPALRTTQTRVRWGLRSSQAVLDWQNRIQLLGEYHYFAQPEPRLGKYRWLHLVPSFSRGFRVLHYRLADPETGA